MNASDILGPSGLIARSLPGYEPRPEQLAMAEAVDAAFKGNRHLLVEAGTGVGKSFAYLVPAIERVTSNGGRVVVSTHTIALQEQLIEKDIPYLQSIYPTPFSACLVKGRANYLGLRRLARTSARQARLLDLNDDIASLHAIEEWAYETTDGSLTDLPRAPAPYLWERVRSDADDCLGRNCPHFQSCFYQRARRRAQAAQILVVNHALLFSDLALRSQGAALLPDYDHVILDEAHTMENVAADHLGVGVTSSQIGHLLNLLHHEKTGRGLLERRRHADAIAMTEQTRNETRMYFQTLTGWNDDRPDWNGRFREPPPFAQRCSSSLTELAAAARDLRDGVDDESERSEWNGISDRSEALARSVERWHGHTSPGWVYWLDLAGRRFDRATLFARPLHIGAALREALFSRMKSVILTSATLTTPGPQPFAYLKSRLSLEEVECVALGSPFDYRRQLRAFVETGLPDPSSAAFPSAACEAIKRYVLMTDGHAFALFTSYDMMNQFARRMRSFFEEARMPLFVQGEGLPRSAMLKAFREMPRSVLFGTDSFWAGVDVPGPALSNIIIVKLPFAVPNHPVVEARVEEIRQSGGNPFQNYQLPEAILKFKQGIGRLIRTKSDTGIVVILDSRTAGKSYGQRFLASLPDCEVNMVGPTDSGSPVD